VDPEEDEPNVGLTLAEFRQAYAQVHEQLGIPMPEALTH